MTFKKGKHAYIGKINCEKCKKEITVYTTQQRFCKICAKINHNEYKIERLKDEENKIKHQELCKNWRLNNLDKKRINQKKYRKKHPEKINAHILSKNIPLKSCCEICGSKDKLEKHHWNYNKPLLVNALCKPCHTIQHVKDFQKSIFAGGNKA